MMAGEQDDGRIGCGAWPIGRGRSYAKDGVRDPRALDYGSYWLVNERTGGMDFGRAREITSASAAKASPSMTLKRS